MPATALMSKRLDEVTAADLEQLCTEGVTEGQYLDFKENLSGRKESGSAWNEGADTIPDAAKSAIARSVVAFANAEGGWIVLGVRETEDRPARAQSITPLRACHDLARRLRQSVFASVDPTPVGLDVRAIEVGADGSGAVVFRMPASPYAPHAIWDGKRLEAYIRRHDECRPMTMRDIQERTLEVGREVSAVERALEETRVRFASYMNRPAPGSVLGYRITTLPSRARFEIEQVYREPWMRDCRRFFDVRKKNDAFVWTFSSALPQLGTLHPILRGAAATFEMDSGGRELFISSSGHVTYWTRITRPIEGIFLDWIGGDLLNVLRIADALRTQSGNADTEYALEFELLKRDPGIAAPVGIFLLAPLGANDFFAHSATLVSPIRTPIWRVGPASDFMGVAHGVMSDVCNSAGWQALPELELIAAR